MMHQMRLRMPRYLIISCILHNKPCKMLSLEQIVGFSTYFNSCGNSKGKLSLNFGGSGGLPLINIKGGTQ